MKTPITLNGKTILVTGSPGFIGANLVIRLLNTLSCGIVVSLDNMNDYYEVSLKEWRLSRIEEAAASSPVKHIFIKPELFIGFAKNIKVGSLMNVCFIISTKTKSTLFPHLKKGKVPL